MLPSDVPFWFQLNVTTYFLIVGSFAVFWQSIETATLSFVEIESE